MKISYHKTRVTYITSSQYPHDKKHSSPQNRAEVKVERSTPILTNPDLVRKALYGGTLGGYLPNSTKAP